MPRLLRCFALLATLAAVPPGLADTSPALSAEDLRQVEGRVEAVLPKLMQATVGIRIPQGGAGSGVIVNPQGLILTAGHVSGTPGRTLRVFLSDGRELRGKSLGRNGLDDSGMIQIEDEGEYPFAELGKSSDLAVGTFAIALGHPGGFRNDRPPVVRVGRYKRQGIFLQTDTVLVGGDSGGPLFDLDGRVIGIHSRIGAPIYDNRHVPIDKFSADWSRLLAGEEWNIGGTLEAANRNRPWLGVEGEEDPGGFRVVAVDQSGPAHKAGLAAGDLITELNGQPINGTTSLIAALGRARIGQAAKVTVVRESGETEELTVTLGRRPAPQG